MIHGIQNMNATNIAYLLWKQDYAKISKVTTMPYLMNNKIYVIAYVTINEWADSERAYKIIQQLKNNETIKIDIDDDNQWELSTNTHNNGDITLLSYTTIIPNDFYEEEETLIPEFANKLIEG
jgi:hypothetical protein